MKQIICLLSIFLLILSCSDTSPEDLVDNEPINELVTYDTDVFPIIQSQCISCHNDNFASGNNSYSSYQQFRNATENGNVIDRITRGIGDPLVMPQGSRLPQTSIDLILQWQVDGYLEN